MKRHVNDLVSAHCLRQFSSKHANVNVSIWIIVVILNMLSNEGDTKAVMKAVVAKASINNMTVLMSPLKMPIFVLKKY